MSLPLFTIARSAFALYEINEATGVIGFDDVAAALGKIALKMALKAHRIDRGALDDMVELAQERVPRVTGRLAAGITSNETDDYFEFRASAQHVSAKGRLSLDYAPFVEFGTGPHELGASAFTRRSRAAHGSPGTEAEPFFYPAVDTALEQRDVAMDEVIPDAATEDGWELE